MRIHLIQKILDDFSEVERAMENMEDAAGSADAEMGVIRDSLEYKLNALKQTWVGTLQDMIDRGKLGNIVDGLTRISEWLGRVISNIGALKTALIALGTVIGSQKLGVFNTKNPTTLLGGFKALSQSKTLQQESNQYAQIYNNLKMTNDPFASFKATDFSTLNNYSDNVKKNLASLQKTIIDTKGTADDAFNGINKLMLQTQQQSTALKTAATTALRTLANGLISLGIGIVISKIVQGIQDLVNSYDDLAKKANEIATKFKENKTQLSDYSKKVSELRAVMEDSSSTTQEVAEATSELYSIQNDLISQYGAYHDGIDLVNGDLEEQLGLIKQINQESAQQAVNEINATRSSLSGATNAVAIYSQIQTYGTLLSTGISGLFLQNYKDQLEEGLARKTADAFKSIKNNNGVRESIKNAFTEEDLLGRDIGEEKFGRSDEAIIKEFENFEASFKEVDDDNINRLIESFAEFENVDGVFKISGAVDDVSNAIIRLQTQLKGLGYENTSLDKQLTKIYNKAQGVVDQSGEAYDTIKYNEIINGNNAKLAEYYYDLVSKYYEIQNAKDEGDSDKVQQLEEDYKSLIKTIAEDPNIEDKYLKYFTNMYPELQDIISEWEFEFKAIPRIEKSDFSEGLTDFIRNNSTEFINTEYNKYLAKGYTDTHGYSVYFKELQEAASLANKNVNQLVDSLHKTDEYRYSSGKNTLLYQPTQTSYTGIEDQKIEDWGLSKYGDSIKNGTLQTVFGNVNMNDRTIIKWNEENLSKFETALKSWGTDFDEHGKMVRSYYDDLKEAYDEGYESLDTVWGTTGAFEIDGIEYDVAFTPIMQTEDGAVFLSRDTVYDYIQSVIDKAAEDGEVSFDEILTIDAESTGKQYGLQFGKGLIAGIGEYTGKGGQNIPALDVGSLMHFSGQYGAYSMAKTDEGQIDTVTPSANKIKYDALYKQELQSLSEAEQEHNDLVDRWYEGLTDEAKEFFDNIAGTLSEEEIAVTFDFNNEVELSNWLYKLQQEADANPIEVDIVTSAEVVEALDKLEDDWDALSTVYESTVTNKETASAGDIQSVNTDFGGIKDDDGNYTTMSTALESYNDKLVENKGDTDAAQEAANELATAYIDLNGTLDNLDEAHADYYEDILKENGIENAHEVVLSRLNKTYKATRANLVKLADAVAGYGEELEASEKTAADFDDTYKDITAAVADLIGVYDQDTGDFISAANIDGQFIADNWDLVQDAIEGVDGALDQLYAKYALINAEKVYVEAGLDTSEFETQLSNIGTLLDIASTWTMEPEALLQNDQFMSALKACWDGSVETANAINAALSTIGMKVEYKTTTKKIRVATASDKSNVHTVYGGENAGKTVTADTIDVDDFEVVATSTGKGTTGTGAKYSGGGSSSSGSGSGGSGDSGSDDSDENDFSNSFDWIEVAINRLEEEISRLDEQVDSTYNDWQTRNEALADSIAKTTSEIELQQAAAEQYAAEAAEVWIPDEYKAKVEAGELSVEDIDENSVTEAVEEYFNTMLAQGIGDSDMIDKYNEGTLTKGDYAEMLSNAIDEYTELYDKEVDALDQVATLTIEKQEKYKEAFENIATEYEDLATDIEKQTSIIEERMTRAEELGYFVNENYYDQLKALESDNLKTLIDERDALIEQLNNAVANGSIKEGSEAWEEMYQKIMDVNLGIEESYTNTAKLDNELRQLQWDKFDWIEEQMDDIATEADFLIGLLQGEKNFEEDGSFNNRGFAQASLIGAKYDNDIAEAQRYADEIEKIDEEIAKAGDSPSKDLISRKQELVDAYRSAIEGAEDEKKAMQSLVKEGIDMHLSHLQELINTYKESLSAAKDLYDYQKNIASQTQNISNLQKQLAAYSGDDSEETRKKRQELQKQLDEAEQGLEETQWDRYISETGDMLDNLYSDYEEYLNDKLEEVKVLMDHMIGYINENGTNITNGLNEIKDEYGLTTQHFEGFDAEANNKLLNTFTGGKFDTDLSAIVASIEATREQIELLTNTAANGADKKVEEGRNDVVINGSTGLAGTEQAKSDEDKSPSVSGTWRQNESTGQWWFEHDDGSYATNAWEKIGGKDFYFDNEGYLAADQYIDGNWINPEGEVEASGFEWQQTDDGKWWYGSNSENYAKGHVKIDGQWYTFDDEGWYLGAYAKGSKSISRSGLGITNEDGSELVWKTSSGALLTPLGQGDMVFTSEMSKRLWEIAKGTIPVSTNLKTPNVSGSSFRNITENNNITISLPNVENYDEFKNAMKNDDELEKFWQEITIGQLMGNNKLNKFKY